MTNSDMPLIQQLFVQLADHFGPRRPALLNSPGVTLAEVGELFTAAADFYDARPWRKIPSDGVIRVSCERLQSGPWYAVVMGQSGIEQGLALYEDLQFLLTQLRGELSDEEAGRRMSAISFTYGEYTDLAPEDLDAAEQHHWPIAGPDAFPCVLRVNPGMAIRTPLKWELQLLTGCLKAIPDFVRERRSQAVIPVTLGGNTWTFQFELLADPDRSAR